MFTASRGVAARDWALLNPRGTNKQFDEYFDNLSDKQLQVRRTTDTNEPTNTAPQEFEKRAGSQVVFKLCPA